MRKLVVLFCATFCWLSLANAQNVSGFIGTVTDPSGAPVPGAKITVTERATQLSRSTVSSSEGFYTIPALRPALYRTTVEAAGFRSMAIEEIRLEADQKATVNFKLELGALAESVVVTGTGVLQVDTVTATLRQVVDNERILEMPLNGRNAASLTLTVAGASSAPTTGVDQGQEKTFPGAVSVSVNGSRGNQMSYMLDGANNQDSFSNVNAPFPFPDALQEFSVQTSNYSAEFGQNAGGVVNVVTKSGTNDLHGGAFDFVRNAVFNARNYFSPKRDGLKRNQFGGTIGGPVTLPFYKGRDKTFFFFGYQGTRNHSLQEGLTSFIPTAANMAGDFSAALQASNPGNPLGRATTIIDPLNGGQAFPGNRIPLSRFDPASLALTKYLPLEQAGVNGLVTYNKPISQTYNEETIRVDHSLSSKDRLTGRYFRDKFSTPSIWDPHFAMTYTDGVSFLVQNALLQETHIFSPTLLNDFRLGFHREHNTRYVPPASPNLNDLGSNVWQPSAYKALESISVTGFFATGTSTSAEWPRTTWTLAEDLRWSNGRHNISVGFRGDLARLDEINNLANEFGVYTFTADATNYALASFMMGTVRTIQQGSGEAKNVRNKFTGLYVQEGYRASSHLTLNVGLRWEPYSPWRDLYDRVEQFRPQDYYAGKKSQKFTNAPAGLFFPGDDGVPQNGVENTYMNFAPRFGFAYDLSGDGKTSLRGGSGIFWDTRQSSFFNSRFAQVTPFSPQMTLVSPPGPFSDPFRGIKNPFPSVFPPPRDIQFPSPVVVITLDPRGKYNTPVTYNWNLTVERQLGKDWLLRAAYVGSRSNHLFRNVELNPAVYTPGSTLGTDQRRVFTGYQSISLASQSGVSRFHSLQATLEKRFSRGLTARGNYTWSKSTDTMPYNWGAQGPMAGPEYVYPWYFSNADQMDRGVSDFDRKHRFVGTIVWQLPGLTGVNSVLRQVLGSWQITGLVTLQSGGPLTLTAGTDRSQTNLADRAVYLGGQAYGPGACQNLAPCVDYLNRQGFAQPAIGGFGNVGKGMLRGPNLVNVDAGIFKSIPVHERLQLQLRAEFFNFSNRVNLSNPSIAVNGTTFGTIRAAGDPRIGQLALKLTF
jgi:Carboxypeptidase regulatory-like domain/TonB-dependent Receptor Plug Domain